MNNELAGYDADWGDDEGPSRSKAARVISRRELLIGLGGLGIGSAVAYTAGSSVAFADDHCPTPTTGPGSTTSSTTQLPPSSTTTTRPGLPTPTNSWSERFSAEEGDVVIDDQVLLDIDAKVNTLTLTATGRLIMDPDTSLTLTSAGNVVVEGELVMQPSSAAVTHRLHFDSVDESKFKGGGMSVIDSDVGLWVITHGLFRANGTPRNPWTRATESLVAGGTQVTVEDASGWQVGDRIAIAPTGAPSPDNGKFHQDSDSAQTYDERTISAISGNVITVDSGLDHDHPQISFVQWDGASRTYGAEVLNLTKNVIVSGTEDGKPHVIFVHCHHAQNMSDVQLDLMGPRQVVGRSNNGRARTAGVVGRYPLHFHHCGDGVRGSVVKNCLVTRSGNRAYVPHESHGVTLDGCVAHDIHGTAFWWDQPGRHNPTGEDPKTHDSLWVRCVASKVYAPPGSENGYRMAGFNLSAGNPGSNTLIDSVAVGVYEDRVTNNNSANSGFHWTEHGHGIWNFRNNLAHNIGGSGVLGWQNDEEIHPIDDFTAYHCSSYGIEHGAYSNFYAYSRLTLVANRLAGIGCHAVTRRTNSVRRRWTDKGEQAPILFFRDVRIDGRGITTDGLRSLSHKIAAKGADGPTLLENVSVEGVTRAAVYEEKGRRESYYVLRNWNVGDGVTNFAYEKGSPSKTVIVAENFNGSSFTETP